MNHEQRALLKSVQKVRGVLDRYPDGVTLSQITGDTQLSSAAARAALLHMKAECEDGLWFDVAVDEVEQSGNAGELEPVQSGSIPAPKSETGIPVSEQKQEVKSELVSSDTGLKTGDPAQVDWSSAPEGATHYAAKYSQYYKRTGYGVMLWDADEWVRLVEFTTTDLDNMGAIPRPTSTSTFVDVPTIVGIDWAQNMTAPVEPEPVCTKSDFAIALEAERQRVYDAAAIGGTAARLAELTGIPVDDVQMHLDVLIDDGAIVERPIIVAMSYKVAT